MLSKNILFWIYLSRPLFLILVILFDETLETFVLEELFSGKQAFDLMNARSMVVFFPGMLQKHHPHGSLNVEQDHLVLVTKLDLVNWL